MTDENSINISQSGFNFNMKQGSIVTDFSYYKLSTGGRIQFGDSYVDLNTTSFDLYCQKANNFEISFPADSTGLTPSLVSSNGSLSLNGLDSMTIMVKTNFSYIQYNTNGYNYFLSTINLTNDEIEVKNFNSIKMVGYSYSENDKSGESHYMIFEPAQGEITGLTASPSSSSSAASKAYVDAKIAALKEKLTNA